MKESWSLLLKSSTWLSLFIPAILSALPEGEQVVSGQVSISHPDANSLQVHASDKSIINFDSFNIQKGESVHFIQPSKKAAVLNRVVGKDPSKIFGQLKSNGKVILVNSNGVFFSPTAQVNVGSLIVSTLDIKNQDFLSDRLQFQLDPDKQASSIVNQGQLTADGSVALLAPHIQNEGIISARAGRVVLASGEKITLDFSGDGLINFMVEGELKDTSIENDGSLHAPEGDVYIHLKTAKKIIKDVVNTDGLEEGVSIVKENNTIKILSKSSILARRIEIDGGKGSDVAISGTLDVSDPSARGGEVTILGDQISLAGAQIDASGAFEGGTVLIGGDYQGLDSLHHSLLLTMDPNSTIRADALGEGNGGKVILWSDGITQFNGNIYAQAGSQGGDGGLVETSGKEGLGCHMGYVNTLALQGKMGTWLLDPTTVNIVATSDPLVACTTPPTCSGGTFNVGTTTINAATSNVTICGRFINVNASINMTHSGVGINLQNGCNPATNDGTLNFGGSGITIETLGGPITIGAYTGDTGTMTVNIPVTLQSNGGEIFLAKTQKVTGTSVLTLDAGSTGGVSLQSDFSNASNLDFVLANAGTFELLSATTMNVKSFVQNSAPSNGVTLFDSPIKTYGATGIFLNANSVQFQFDCTMITTVGGGPVLINNADTLTINAGATGGFGTTFNLGGLFSQFGPGGVVFSPRQGYTPGTHVIDTSTNNRNITFNSAINVNNDLSLIAGTGAVIFNNAITGDIPTRKLTVNSSSTTSFNSGGMTNIGTLTVAASSSLNFMKGTYTFGSLVSGATPTLNLGEAAVATTLKTNTFNFPNTTNLNGPATIDTTFSTGGAPLSLNTVNLNVYALTLTAGQASTSNITLSGNMTGTANSKLLITQANNVSFPTPATSVAIGSLQLNGATGAFTNAGSTFTLSGGGTPLNLVGNVFTFAQNITALSGGATITNSGTLTINPSVAFSLHGGFVQNGTGSVTLNGSINTSAGNGIISFLSPVTLSGPSTLTAGTGDILFSQPINGNFQNLTIGGARNVTFNGGTPIGLGTLAINNATGTVFFLPLTTDANAYAYNSLTFGTSPTAINIGGTNPLITTINTASALTFPSPVTLLGSTTISSAGTLAFASTINGTTAGSQNLMLSTSGGNPITFASPVGGSTALGPFSISNASAVTFAAGATLKALSVSETGVTGLSTFDQITTTGTTSTGLVSLASGSYQFNGNVNAAGPFSITGGTTVTFAAATTLTANSVMESNVSGASSFQAINSLGGITLQGTGGANTFLFNSPVTAGGIFNLNTAQSVTFAGGAILTANSVMESNVTGASNFRTINSSGGITLLGTGGANTFEFHSPVTAVGAFTLDSAQSVTFDGGATLKALSVTQTNVTMDSIYQGITTTGTSTTGFVSLSSDTYQFNISVNAAGPFTINGGTTVTFEGGAGLTAASVTESDVTGASSFRTINSLGGITLVGTGGANTFLFQAPVTAGGDFSLDTAQSVTFLDTLTALSVTETAVTGLSTFDQITTTGTTLTGLVSLASGSYQFNQNVNAVGPFSITGGTTVTFAAGKTLSAASVTESGVSGATSFQAINAAGFVDLTGTGAGSSFTFNQPVLAGGAFSLNTAQSVTFNPGATLTALSVTQNNVTMGSIYDKITTTGTSTTGSVSLATGTTYQFNNDVIAAGPFSINGGTTVTFAAGKTLSAASVTESGVSGATSFQAINAAGFIDLTGTGAGSSFIFNQPVLAGGAFSLNTAQSVTFNPGATLTALSVTQNNVTMGSIYDKITTTGTSTTGSVSLATGTTYQFNNDVIAAGPFSINGGTTVTFAAGKTLSAASVTESGVSGATSFQAINATGFIDLTGTGAGSSFIFNQPVLAGGAFSLNTAQSVTFNPGATLTALSVTQNNVTMGSIYDKITTTGTSTTGSVSLATGTTYQFNNDVIAAGPFSITGGTTVTFAAGKTLSAASVTESGVSGATSFQTINAAGFIDLTGTSGSSFTFNQPVLAEGAFSLNTALSVTFVPGATLTALSVETDVTDVSIFDQITTTGTTTSGFVSLASGSFGSYQFNKDVTSAGPFSITGGANVMFAAGTTLSAASIFESVTGPSLFQTMIATTGPINLTGTSFNFNGPITSKGSNGDITVHNTLGLGIVSFNQRVMTTGHGNVIINNTGELSILTSAPFSVHGDFKQVGTGPVIMGGSITTLSSDIIFNSPVTLTADTLYDSSAGNGNIIFEDTLNSDGLGHWDVTLSSGGGSIDFQGVVGGINRLNAMIILTANNVTTVGLNAALFEELRGTGTTRNNGPWNFTAAPVSSIQQVLIATGAIRLGDTITLSATPSPVVMNAFTDIQNVGAPVAIMSNGVAYFNALNGNVGSAASPIRIENGNGVIVAGAKNSAYFEGAIFHNYLAPPPYVTDVPSNPPCFIAFNGITIKSACVPPPQPSGGAGSVKPSNFPPRNFFLVGAYSIYDNLIDDFYFFPDFIHDYYLNTWSAGLFYELSGKEQTSENYHLRGGKSL